MAELRDPHLHIEFYGSEKEDLAASREAGRPIFKTVEMVCIKYVGDNKREHHAPAHEKFIMSGENGEHLTYAERFPDHYEAFKRQEKEAISGSPLDAMASLPRTKIAELKALNIHTVEALAGLNTSGIKRLGMGARELVEQAKAWLDDADTGAALAEANAKNAELEKRLAALETALNNEPEQQAAYDPRDPSADNPHHWTDDQLRAYLTEQGATPRANANRDKMIDAVREFMAAEAA